MREAAAADGGARAAPARPGEPHRARGTGHRAVPAPRTPVWGWQPPPARRGGGDSSRGACAGEGGSIPAPRSSPAPFCVYLSSLIWGGHPSFVAVVGIFDESFGMRCWQRFCINISDNMFRQISSLKLFALFDKGRGAARNATGLMCSLLPTRRAIIRPVAPYVNIQLF